MNQYELDVLVEKLEGEQMKTKTACQCEMYQGSTCEKCAPTQKHAGPYPLRMDCGRNPEMFVIVTNQGNHYATTYDPAAAHLIVSAPELLDALREAEAVLRYYGKSHPGSQGAKAWDMARAAIAEAQGVK